jgi:hypothetical protein
MKTREKPRMEATYHWRTDGRVTSEIIKSERQLTNDQSVIFIDVWCTLIYNMKRCMQRMQLFEVSLQEPSSRLLKLWNRHVGKERGLLP